ncbi:LysR family transcriptional regulator [Pseudomonas gingeri NCPPB 3146 = LMG 5327]|uniref:LysR family transcriptional regulator n=2 Tax=Pseudomonas gingeri TaxID=117681 RepID=A0A7Y7XU41_9PSED|nr:LysR family transcriptional regulator [Pseudomonas gingeri]NWC12339.1 LysR family transcriptional regulator [Pseudomonas gingeri]NWE47689.1 LysR family transcriptional regulator [Pseudomonas gingeri]NWE69695.1 LysR family transcriptional regulator [Pseudomonas gingeri]PNQ88580.1 LysR family transcriptional regulator [Pseudomonas gingeri NCPPB 3146 = LMG 5327]
MDSVSSFNVFVQVAENRSFVAAGRLLGVTASAVGKRISALEEELGVRLFHRSTRSVTLTAEGSLFLNRSRRILAEIEAAQAELSQAHQAPRGRLRVSLPQVSEPFLSVIAEFRLAYPQVDLDLDFTDRRVDVIEEGFDAVIRSGEIQDSRLVSRSLGTYRMLLVGAPDYFARHPSPETASDLRHHACIQFRYPNTGKLQEWPLPYPQLEPEFQLTSAVVCNQLEARVRFALKGLGIAYLPEFAIAGFLASGQLVSVLPQCTASEEPFRILWPSGKHLAPKLRAFVDYLCKHLSLMKVSGFV